MTIYKQQEWNPYEAIDEFILPASHSLHQFWIYPFLKRWLNQHQNSSEYLILDGYLMNEVIGGLSTLKMTSYENLQQFYRPLHKNFSFLFGERIASNYYENLAQQINMFVANCPSDNPYDRFLYFTILGYGRRFTMLFSIIHSYLGSVGLPILDYHLFDFCLSLPFSYKINSKFYRDMVAKKFPHIAQIPWSRNRLPLTSEKKQHRMVGIIKKINRYKYYFTRITKIETLPPNNKNRRFRTDKVFRQFYLDILFNDQTFDKRYVTREGVKRIVELIDSGRNYFYILESIALIELVIRQLHSSKN